MQKITAGSRKTPAVGVKYKYAKRIIHKIRAGLRLLSQFVEGMNLADLYSTYERIPEKPSLRTLLKIVLYAYMNGNFSSRSMETRCRRDMNFMFLLEGSSVPDYATFVRFRSLHFAACAKRILAESVNYLYQFGEISGDAIFIDGTKIEANANKYTFVWKKSCK